MTDSVVDILGLMSVLHWNFSSTI